MQKNACVTRVDLEIVIDMGIVNMQCPEPMDKGALHCDAAAACGCITAAAYATTWTQCRLEVMEAGRARQGAERC